MTKIFNVLDDFSDNMRLQIDTKEYFSFCNTTGSKMVQGDLLGNEYHEIIKVLHNNSQSLKEFLAYYVVFVNCQTDKSGKKWKKKQYRNILETVLNDAKIPYEIFEDKDGFFVFPQGAKELDDALVSDVLEWLANYPKTQKMYITALKQYVDGEYPRDVADNLRKSLEAFFQEFLGNERNLETNKNDICKYLGNQGVDPGISGLFQPLINAYKNINDRIVKHNDKFDKKLLEFVLYQTGILIRMVLVVKENENKAN